MAVLSHDDPKPLRNFPRDLVAIVHMLQAASLHEGDEVNHITAAARDTTQPALEF
jgi:hypothetical protein